MLRENVVYIQNGKQNIIMHPYRRGTWRIKNEEEWYMSERKKRLSYFRKKWQLYAMLILPLISLLIFNYGPMYGVVIAFKNYQIGLGINKSPWAENAGMANFIRFFKNYNFVEILRNTLILSIYSMAINMPAPLILAISLNYVKSMRFKKAVQMISYAPYFISTVVFVAIINMMFNTRTGVLGILCDKWFGINVLGTASIFPSLYVFSGVWQGVGFSAIIYIAALAGVDPQLHEAAIIDGATIVQRIRHIDIPSILPTIVILLILNMGSILNVGYEKVFAMQNQNNIGMSEVISTYAYKVGLVGSFPDFSYSTAIGLFQSAVGLVLILLTNWIADKITGNGFI